MVIDPSAQPIGTHYGFQYRQQSFTDWNWSVEESLYPNAYTWWSRPMSDE